MLYKSNIVALVGGGKNPKFPQNKLILWDDAQYKSVGEISFRTDIKSIKLRKTRLYYFDFFFLLLMKYKNYHYP